MLSTNDYEAGRIRPIYYLQYRCDEILVLYI